MNWFSSPGDAYDAASQAVHRFWDGLQHGVQKAEATAAPHLSPPTETAPARLGPRPAFETALPSSSVALFEVVLPLAFVARFFSRPTGQEMGAMAEQQHRTIAYFPPVNAHGETDLMLGHFDAQGRYVAPDDALPVADPEKIERNLNEQLERAKESLRHIENDLQKKGVKDAWNHPDTEAQRRRIDSIKGKLGQVKEQVKKEKLDKQPTAPAKPPPSADTSNPYEETIKNLEDQIDKALRQIPEFERVEQENGNDGWDSPLVDAQRQEVDRLRRHLDHFNSLPQPANDSSDDSLQPTGSNTDD